MNPEKFKHGDHDESLLEKAGASAKKVVIMGAVAAAGISGELQAEDLGHESLPTGDTNVLHVEKNSEKSDDILSKESVANFLEGVKKDGIDALSSSHGKKYSQLIKKIDVFFGKVDLMSPAHFSVEQKQSAEKVLVELHHTLGVIERNLPNVIQDMKTSREDLVRSQATVHGGAYDLSAADLKEAGEMIMAQRVNEIHDTEKLEGKTSVLQGKISKMYHELTGSELK
jgi:hypothetical protein